MDNPSQALAPAIISALIVRSRVVRVAGERPPSGGRVLDQFEVARQHAIVGVLLAQRVGHRPGGAARGGLHLFRGVCESGGWLGRSGLGPRAVCSSAIPGGGVKFLGTKVTFLSAFGIT